MNFNEATAIFLDKYRISTKNSTYYGITKAINKYIEPFFNNLPIAEITPYTLLEWSKKIELKNISAERKNRMRTKLIDILQEASDYHSLKNLEYHLPEFKQKTYKKKTPKINIWTIPQFKQLLDVISDYEDKVIFRLLLESGMRIGELQALQVGDIDIKNNAIIIDKTYDSRSPKKGLTPPKSLKAVRSIKIPKQLIELIKPLLKQRVDFLFVSTRDPSRPIPIKTIRNHFDEYIKKVHLARIRLHDLRHTHASLLIEQGWNLLEISERLGHASITETIETYAHLFSSSYKRQEEELNILFNF